MKRLLLAFLLLASPAFAQELLNSEYCDFQQISGLTGDWDSDDLDSFRRENLLLRSDDFSATWSGVTYPASATADTITAAVGNSRHGMKQDATGIVAGGQ